jgi:hypothetical protein
MALGTGLVGRDDSNSVPFSLDGAGSINNEWDPKVAFPAGEIGCHNGNVHSDYIRSKNNLDRI